MNTHTKDLARIANSIDLHGIAANETAVSMVVDRARIAGVDRVLLSVLSDVAQPEVARFRAFGVIATALAAGPAIGQAMQHPVMLAA